MKPIITLIIAQLLSPLVPLQAAGKPSPGSRPNILHIHADDHRPDGLRALGNPLLQTPNLDSLVERGMTFTHCYTMGSMQGAVCTPSRTMMLTGRSWLRITKAPGALPNAADPATFLPRVLAAAGYQTWHMGKKGNGFPAGLQEFETSIIDDAKGATPQDDRAHCSQRLADTAIKFLQARTAEKNARPFYIYLAPPVPHDPRSAEPQFHALYDPAKIPLSPAFLPLHPWDNGEMTVRDEKLAPWPRTPEDTKQQNADYYSCVTGLDHHVGRIFAALKAAGQWDNTIIIFSGDNGLSLGEHGLFGKQNLYEFGGMHVPLVIAGPGIPKGKSEALVYLMDLFPTFAEFAGAKLPEGIEGRSLRPIIDGKSPKVRDVLYTAYRDCQRAIRDDRWKLIRYPLVDRTQLFDLSTDPHELNNLADKPAHAAKLAELTFLLGKEMSRCADQAPLQVANPKPAEWSPPTAEGKSKGKKSKKNQAGYRVIAPLPNACLAITAYALSQKAGKDTVVRSAVFAADCASASTMLQPYPGSWKAPAEGLVAYDWHTGKGAKLDQPLEFSLTGFADKLVLLCPVRAGWAVVGRVDKYLSPVAVKSQNASANKLTLTLAESGPLVIWSAKGRPLAAGSQFEGLGNGFWKANLPVGQVGQTLTITRAP